MERFISIGRTAHITEDGKERLVLLVDPDIVNYYLSTLPLGTQIQRQKYAPHITIVDRNEKAENLASFNNVNAVVFYYGSDIQEDETYYWVNTFSNELVTMRWACGLKTPFPCMNKKFPRSWEALLAYLNEQVKGL